MIRARQPTTNPYQASTTPCTDAVMADTNWASDSAIGTSGTQSHQVSGENPEALTESLTEPAGDRWRRETCPSHHRSCTRCALHATRPESKIVRRSGTGDQVENQTHSVTENPFALGNLINPAMAHLFCGLSSTYISGTLYPYLASRELGI